MSFDQHPASSLDQINILPPSSLLTYQVTHSITELHISPGEHVVHIPHCLCVCVCSRVRVCVRVCDATAKACVDTPNINMCVYVQCTQVVIFSPEILTLTLQLACLSVVQQPIGFEPQSAHTGLSHSCSVSLSLPQRSES